MVKKIIFFTLIFYFLALWQVSFLAHFPIFGIVPNFVVAAVVFLNLFQRPEDYSGLWAGLIAGFFLDIFSAGFIGFYTLICLAASLFVKLIFKKYVWVSFG